MSQKNFDYDNHRIIFSEELVHTAIAEMARHVSADFLGKEITLVGVLNGGAFLLIRLATELERYGLVKGCHFDFLRVSSYREGRSAGALTLTDQLQESVAGKNIVLVDDVGDTLNTVGALQDYIRAHHPESLKIAVLLEKPDKHLRTDVVLDYVGIKKNGVGFVYGCGMDLNGRYRALPFIAEAPTEI